jgi:galactose mutarotase-like enzyme
MYTIENDDMKVLVNQQGAELSSIVNKVNGLEYLWNADPAYWAKKSPVLFPIVGTLKEDKYYFEDKSYSLGRHGFAREKLFLLKEQTNESISFELLNDGDTIHAFPFQFSFVITYTVDKSSLHVRYLVTNTGSGDMYFSVGGHPAFRLPLAAGLKYEDYFLLFNKTEEAGRWPIDAQGLIEGGPVPLLSGTDRLQLSKSLFYQDAIVFKELRSDEVQLKSERHPAGFSFSFKGFPYLGIWAAKDADFLCIEPWCGVADSVTTNQHLPDKEGIVSLKEGGEFERTWTLSTW